MRPRISSSWRSACSWVIFSLATRPASWPWVTSRALVRPVSTNSCLTSLRTTGMPAEAMTWAISPPMVPAPTTAALKTNIGRRLLRQTARGRPSRPLAASVPPMSRGSLLERGLHIAVLWALAVAQPLFHLLGRNPEFFATRGSPPGEIVAFALAGHLRGAAGGARPRMGRGPGRRGGAAGAYTSSAWRCWSAAIALQAISLAGTLPALVLAARARRRRGRSPTCGCRRRARS